MSTQLAELPVPTTVPAAQRLRTTTAAVRISFMWLGTRKALTPHQRAQAADTFGAEGEYISAGKKLLDTKHPRFKAVSSVRNRARSYWASISLPYPEPGIRLIRQDQLGLFQDQMVEFKEELEEAVERLDEQYVVLRAAAQERLGSLYNEADYPRSLVGMFDITWDFPSVEPPNYLQQLNPELYQQECRRVQARFDEAIQMAEQAFIDELSGLVSHLTERLGGHEDGRPKIFRDTVVENLRDFFARFRSLNVRSNEQLDALVSQCQQIVQGVQPQELRDNGGLRQQVASQLSGVQSVLDGLLVDRPRRRIIRRRSEEREMHLIIDPVGRVRCLYAETIDLARIGRLTISRGSHVEPNDAGQWSADLSPVGGPRLGPFPQRSDALVAEAEWLDTHWLSPKSAT